MTDTYKTLAQHVTTSSTTSSIYAVPLNKQVSVSNIQIVNSSESDTKYTISVVPASDTSAVYRDGTVQVSGFIKELASFNLYDTGPAGGVIMLLPDPLSELNPDYPDSYYEVMFDYAQAGLRWSTAPAEKFIQDYVFQWWKMGKGESVTQIIVDKYGSAAEAAYHCSSLTINYNHQRFSDFFLPSIFEFNAIMVPEYFSPYPYLWQAGEVLYNSSDSVIYTTQVMQGDFSQVAAKNFSSPTLYAMPVRKFKADEAFVVTPGLPTDIIDEVITGYFPEEKHKVIARKQLSVGSHHEITGGIQLSAGDTIIVSSDDPGVIFNMYGVEMS